MAMRSISCIVRVFAELAWISLVFSVHYTHVRFAVHSPLLRTLSNSGRPVGHSVPPELVYKPRVSGLDIHSPEPFLGAPHTPPSIRYAPLRNLASWVRTEFLCEEDVPEEK
ncbi:hypothetical protein DFH08DRAFT_148121 [Mycena albidolilacea]|uniref:Uncharacterized protein n=1 Tax=Mycena albidolilacea TaxID=1033008 RepID=A0AAD7A2K4_9AGAR|nr:hypothetical protein DFH08DRAFT_148121 [Mycena albidolilacea]